MLEADFLRYYRLDLRAVLWGPAAFGVRRIFALVVGLPAESGLFRLLAADHQEQEQPQPKAMSPGAAAKFFPSSPPRGVK